MVRYTVLCLSILLSPTPALGETVLNFPRFSFQTGVFTGIAIVNPTPGTATVTFTAYGTNGQPLQGPGFQNPKVLQIQANRQIAQNIAVSDLSSELFGAALDSSVVGWVQATSPTDGLTGFFLFLNSPTTFFDGADLPVSSQKIIFNNVRVGDGFSTELNVFNPGNGFTNLQLHLYGDESTPLASGALGLPGKGVVRLDVSGYFGIDSLEGVGAVTVTSLNAAVPVAGFEVVRTPNDLLGLTARPSDEMLQTLFIPQLAIRGGIRTDLALTNYSTQDVDLVISAHQPNGSLYPGAVFPTTLAPNASLMQDMESLFPPAMGDDLLEGYVRVEATAQAINGSVSYTVPASGSLAAVASLPQPVTRAIFSQLATDLGFFTGLAMLNPGTLPANLRVVALTPNGQIIGRFTTVLAPGQRVSMLIDEYIPEAANRTGGYFWVRSNLPVFLTGLFGLPNVLVNVPPQPAPEGFEPDSGLANLVVSPIQAFVPTGGNKAFSALGTPGPFTWAVNDDVNGNAQLGTIAAGNYTAPPTAPLPLPLVVTAESASGIGGAALDVLDPMTVADGLGQIQSIAFLQGLDRLYTAELTAAAGLAAQGSPPDLLALSTEIYETTGGGTRTLIGTYSGETISKILPLEAKDDREYLILANQTSGQIIRFRPPTDLLPATDLVVKSGLSSPSTMAFDVDGGILVFGGGAPVKVTLAELEAGLPSASSEPPFAVKAAPSRASTPGDELALTADLANSPPSGLAQSGRKPAPNAPPKSGSAPALPRGTISTFDGAAVDACTGDVYISDRERGRVGLLDRLSGNTKTIVDDLADPGQMLGFYRRDVGCPFSFQLLVVEKGRDRVLLVSPSQDLVEPWIDAPGANDIIFLNGATTLAESGTVVLGQAPENRRFPAGNIGGPGSILSVEVPNLYEDTPLNAPLICPGTVQFAEFNLAQGVRSALGLDGGVPIPCALAAQLDSLQVQDVQIQNLQGMEFMTGLVELDLGFNLIIDIHPLSSLVGLKVLVLNANLISDIHPTSSLSGLDTLDLDQNNINDLTPLAGLTSLTFLNLDRNQISDISPLANLTLLQTLGLLGANLKDLSPLEDLVQLDLLNLSATGISDISELAGLSRLTILALEGNSISDLRPLRGLQNLRLLLLRVNNISDISPLVQNPGLGQGDQVDLRNNPLDQGDCPDIFALIERGVTVVHSAPCG